MGRAEKDARYRQSAKGKAAAKRYQQSEKGKLASAKYAQSEKGRASLAKYQQSEKGKETISIYYQSERGKLAFAKASAKSRQGEKYKVTQAKHKARRKAMPILDYPDFILWMYKVKPRCIKCNCAYGDSFEADHIIPIAEGGTNKWTNLQPLCRECHRLKSNEDISRIARLKREGGILIK